jgi:hypothetical protein
MATLQVLRRRIASVKTLKRLQGDEDGGGDEVTRAQGRILAFRPWITDAQRIDGYCGRRRSAKKTATQCLSIPLRTAFHVATTAVALTEHEWITHYSGTKTDAKRFFPYLTGSAF